MSLGTSRSSKKTQWGIFAVIVTIAAAASYLYFVSVNRQYSSITSFKECVDAGFPLLETYPEQCKMPGKNFVNKDQIREVEATSTESGMTKDFLNQSYVINGTETSFISSSSQSATSGLVYADLLFEESFNADSLKDKVFVGSRMENGTKQYYLLLALGLYSGETAPANGVQLGTSTPQYILKNKDGTLRVVLSCDTTQLCFKNFRVVSGILEPLK